MFLWTLAQLFEYHYSDLLWSRVQVKATPVMDLFGHSKPYTNSLARQTVISRRHCNLATSKTQVKIMFNSCATKTCTVVLLILIGQHAPTTNIKLGAVILRQCMEIDWYPTIISTTAYVYTHYRLSWQSWDTNQQTQATWVWLDLAVW